MCLGRGVQLSPVGLLLYGAVSTVLVAAREDGDKIALLEAAVAFVCGAEGVGVEEVLGYHCEFGEDCTVPSVCGIRLLTLLLTIASKYLLHDMLERVVFGLLEVVTSVDGVEPGVQEELCPLSVSDDKTARRQAVLVLGDDKIYSVTF